MRGWFSPSKSTLVFKVGFMKRVNAWIRFINEGSVFTPEFKIIKEGPVFTLGFKGWKPTGDNLAGNNKESTQIRLTNEGLVSPLKSTLVFKARFMKCVNAWFDLLIRGRFSPPNSKLLRRGRLSPLDSIIKEGSVFTLGFNYQGGVSFHPGFNY